MSQKKVDKYKAGKYDRNRTSKKERLIDRLEILAWVVICVAMIGWIGFSAYSKIAQKDASTVQETVMDTSAVDNYVSGLSAASSDAE
nr:hypothetical protein [uncultured Blautia sp.]